MLNFPKPILWRSSIQWIGGLYFLFSIIFLIDIYDDSLKKSLTNFLSFNSSEVLKQTIKIFVLYSCITILIFFILNIFDIRTIQIDFIHNNNQIFFNGDKEQLGRVFLNLIKNSIESIQQKTHLHKSRRCIKSKTSVGNKVPEG